MAIERYIGIMSGTSMDAIDAVLIEYDPSAQILHTIAIESLNLPTTLRSTLLDIATQQHVNVQALGEADVQLALLFSQVTNTLLQRIGIPPAAITAIGSHGQTIRHHPDSAHPFSMQIANPSVIAEHTGITTVADFRMADIAAGGQGAPLVPAFHHAAFCAADRIRAIINIGGMANISLLHPSNNSILGYDTGPGNILLDLWISTHLGPPYDAGGQWARDGIVHLPLLNQMLNDPYLQKAPPKSTGREHFNSDWLNRQLINFPKLRPVDIQTTLTEFTAQTIASCVQSHICASNEFKLEVYLCGGGARNQFLQERIQALLPDCYIGITNELGIDVQMVEAAAFAWLAAQTLYHRPGNCPSATGARKTKILGGIYPAS